MNTDSAAESPPIHCTHTELRDPAVLVEHPRNPNRHPQKQIELLARIIRHQGWRNPIVISARSGFVVAGHGRLAAARLLGVAEVPVDVQAFATEADEWAHLVADNRIAELADMDSGGLGELLRDLGDVANRIGEGREHRDADLAGQAAPGAGRQAGDQGGGDSDPEDGDSGADAGG